MKFAVAAALAAFLMGCSPEARERIREAGETVRTLKDEGCKTFSEATKARIREGYSDPSKSRCPED